MERKPIETTDPTYAESHYWRSATLAVILWFVIQIPLFAVMVRIVDPKFSSIPPISIIVPAGTGLLTSLLIRIFHSTWSRGVALGIFTASLSLLPSLIFIVADIVTS